MKLVQSWAHDTFLKPTGGKKKTLWMPGHQVKLLFCEFMQSCQFLDVKWLYLSGTKANTEERSFVVKGGKNLLKNVTRILHVN